MDPLLEYAKAATIVARLLFNFGAGLELRKTLSRKAIPHVDQSGAASP